MLFKSGEETEANKLKSETSNLKFISKDLQEQIQKADANLISLESKFQIYLKILYPQGIKKRTMKKFSSRKDT